MIYTRPDKDPIAVTPNMSGQHGRAWRINLNGTLAAAGGEHATLVGWIIEVPWAHPLWHSYVLWLIHLRPMADGRPTLTYLPDASHELHLSALDPDKPRSPVIAGDAGPSVLTPMNFAAQMRKYTDSDAIDRINCAVRDVVDGRLHPDTDFRSQWIERFGDNMMKDRAPRHS